MEVGKSDGYEERKMGKKSAATNKKTLHKNVVKHRHNTRYCCLSCIRTRHAFVRFLSPVCSLFF